MRWFLTRAVPPVDRVLLVESGPRELGEKALAQLRRAFGERTPIDVLGCVPAPLEGSAEYWDVTPAQGWAGRRKLLSLLRKRRPPVAAILAGGDPIMAPWRWAALAWLPSKTLIVNENADFFWLDRGHLSAIAQFLQHRSGLGGESALRTVFRGASFPFVFVYLLLYAAYVHSLRAVRLALGVR